MQQRIGQRRSGSSGFRQGARRRWSVWLAGLAGVLVWVPAAGVNAQERERPSVRAGRSQHTPEIDGVLDDPAWRDAPVMSALTQVEPSEGVEPTELTEIRVLADGVNLYFAIRCYDRDPDAIIARRLRRDESLTQDDRIAIVIDPFLDRRNGFFFQVNPLGTRSDGLIENSRLIRDWDGIWYAKGRIDSKGWTAEIAIPYQTLTYDPDAAVWGLNIQRGIRRRGETNRWASPLQSIGFTNIAEAGDLTDMKIDRAGIGLDVVPSATGRYVDDPRDAQLDGSREDREYTRGTPSLDVRYKLLPSLTSSTTVNTDFGVTETDERQVNLTRFSLFFPEKRDFFLQDAGIFEFSGIQRNGRPFFSRRIGLAPDGQEVPLRAGTKITGRLGPVNLGILSVLTDSYSFVDDVDDDGVDDFRKVGSKILSVGRVSVNLFEESDVGVIVTHGDPSSNASNTLMGGDLRLRTSRFRGEDRVLESRAWFQHTRSSGAQKRGNAYGLRVDYPNDRVNWTLLHETFEDNYNPALGFSSRNGIRFWFANGRYRWRPDGFIQTVDARATGHVTTDMSAETESARIELFPVTLRTELGDGFEIRYLRRYENLKDSFEINDGIVVPAKSQWNDRVRIRANLGEAREFSASAEVSWGGFFTGNRLDWSPEFSWRPSPHFRIGASYIENRINLPEGNFTVRIARLNLDFLFTPDISWVTLIQYDNQSDSYGVNSRLRWIITEGREFFVVFNQRVDEVGGDLERGRTEPLVRMEWTFRF